MFIHLIFNATLTNNSNRLHKDNSANVFLYFDTPRWKEMEKKISIRIRRNWIFATTKIFFSIFVIFFFLVACSASSNYIEFIVFQINKGLYSPSIFKKVFRDDFLKVIVYLDLVIWYSNSTVDDSEDNKQFFSLVCYQSNR